MTTTTIDDLRWTAVVERDRAATFFYSVRTTGVYCRPWCGSRRPRRANVAFHASPAEAERAGFRPCKRCKPSGPTVAARQAALIARACRKLETAARVPSLDQLADGAGLSRYYFHRLFKQVTGVTPKAYAATRRADRVRDELAGRGSVTQAIYQAGFGSSGRFYAKAGGLLGMTPSAWKAGGRGAVIRFAVGECSLGSILVASSERGVCAIELGDDPDALARALQDRFPRATLLGGDPRFERLVARVIGFVEAPATGLDLPLDVRGTAFQHRVWRALRGLPAGTTASYRELAKRIGAPSAVRAVAQACAANPIAVAIPCHRVVRTDGALSGYRWGVERKRALLAREARP